eukprot:1146088-Pelagomonas_calceolata.AAC.10
MTRVFATSTRHPSRISSTRTRMCGPTLGPNPSPGLSPASLMPEPPPPPAAVAVLAAAAAAAAAAASRLIRRRLMVADEEPEAGWPVVWVGWGDWAMLLSAPVKTVECGCCDDKCPCTQIQSIYQSS